MVLSNLIQRHTIHLLRRVDLLKCLGNMREDAIKSNSDTNGFISIEVLVLFKNKAKS